MTGPFRGRFFLLMAVAVLVLSAGIGLRDPWPADEPRFALIAQDMVEHGSWLLPNVGGVLYPDKPPMHFWVVAVLYALTGSLRFSFLFPAFLAGLGTLALVTDLGRRLWGDTAGIWCGAVLLSLLQFPLQMKSGQLDGPLCFWTTLSLYGLCRHVLLGPDWRWYAIGGLAAGLGVITKGVGFLSYLIIVPALLAARFGWPIPRLQTRDWRLLLAPGLTALAIGAWLIPMLLATSFGDDPARIAYRDNILFHQTVTRYANSWGHIKPPWYLWTSAIPWLWLPATSLLPWLIPAWCRDLRQRQNAPLLVLGSWILLVLLFFSLSAGKRSVYIFPAAPAFALIVGAYASKLATRPSVRWTLVAAVTLLGLLLTAIGTYGALFPAQIAAWVPDATEGFQASLVVFSVGAAMAAATLIMALRRPLGGVASGLVIFWLGLSLLVAPSLNDVRSGRALMHDVDSALAADQVLGLAGWPEQFLLQASRPLVHFGFRRNPAREVEDAIAWLGAGDDRRLLVAERQIEECLQQSAPAPLGRAHRRDWMLLGSQDIRPGCRSGRISEPTMRYQYRPRGRS